MHLIKKGIIRTQGIPIVFTAAVFLLLSIILFLHICLLNIFPLKEKIAIILLPMDILVGLTIYLKTSIDFALFIGGLMHAYPGTKNRIAIEIGTAIGNGLGTLIVLTIWTFFKEIPLLMAIMISIASLVLLQMAQDSLDEFLQQEITFPFREIAIVIRGFLRKINNVFSPVTAVILPHHISVGKPLTSFKSLLFFSFFIPFILGLDDFAGYIPLFSIIHVFGFAVGVFLGHMLLNISLFASPAFTIKAVKNSTIMFLGSLAFIGIAIWGVVEVFRLF